MMLTKWLTQLVKKRKIYPQANGLVLSEGEENNEQTKLETIFFCFL